MAAAVIGLHRKAQWACQSCNVTTAQDYEIFRIRITKFGNICYDVLRKTSRDFLHVFLRWKLDTVPVFASNTIFHPYAHLCLLWTYTSNSKVTNIRTNWQTESQKWQLQYGAHDKFLNPSWIAMCRRCQQWIIGYMGRLSWAIRDAFDRESVYILVVINDRQRGRDVISEPDVNKIGCTSAQ